MVTNSANPAVSEDKLKSIFESWKTLNNKKDYKVNKDSICSQIYFSTILLYVSCEVYLDILLVAFPLTVSHSGKKLCSQEAVWCHG